MSRPRHPMLLLLIMSLLALTGCSSKGPVYPEDHARYVRLDQTVESLRKSYVQKDVSALTALMLPNESTDRLLADMRKDFDEFQDISLDWAIERVVIDDEQIDVFLHWRGHWKPTPDDAGIRDRGHALLRLTGLQSILLAGTGGDVPFGMALRQTVPAPGAPPS